MLSGIPLPSSFARDPNHVPFAEFLAKSFARCYKRGLHLLNFSNGRVILKSPDDGRNFVAPSMFFALCKIDCMTPIGWSF